MAGQEVDPDKLEIADEMIAERRVERPGQTACGHDPLATADHRRH